MISPLTSQRLLKHIPVSPEQLYVLLQQYDFNGGKGNSTKQLMGSGSDLQVSQPISSVALYLPSSTSGLLSAGPFYPPLNGEESTACLHTIWLQPAQHKKRQSKSVV